jgi:hypothetical protein
MVSWRSDIRTNGGSGETDRPRWRISPSPFIRLISPVRVCCSISSLIGASTLASHRPPELIPHSLSSLSPFGLPLDSFSHSVWFLTQFDLPSNFVLHSASAPTRFCLPLNSLPLCRHTQSCFKLGLSPNLISTSALSHDQPRCLYHLVAVLLCLPLDSLLAHRDMQRSFQFGSSRR